MSKFFAKAVMVGGSLGLLACGSKSPAPRPLPAPISTPAPKPILPSAKRGTLPVLDIRDPKALKSLEELPKDNLSFGAILLQASALSPNATQRGLINNADLEKNNPAYRALVEQLQSDLKVFDKNLGVPTVKVNADAKKFPEGNVGRQFDERWLKSPYGYFLLTGIINRFDRKDFSRPENCGEVRFIYRLAYQKSNYTSRLPFFLSFVFEYPHQEDCSDFARKWQPPDQVKPENLNAWLLEEPLNPAWLRFKQLELNAQVVRFPAGLMKETAGEAVYLLKVYRFVTAGQGLALESQILENTPDVRRLQSDPQLRSQLLDYIRANLMAIDQGVFRLPDTFLSKEALSYSTMGNMRLANKPFDAIFPGQEFKDFPDLSQGSFAFVKSPQALIERLNNATCMGCHQGNSTAGFHFMGLDREGFFNPTNHIQMPTSPHYHQDLFRRTAYLQASLGGRVPEKLRPLSYAPLAEGTEEKAVVYRQAGVDEFCILNATEHFQKNHVWNCGSEALECRSLVQNKNLHLNIGQCVPKQGEEKLLFAGQSCREGLLSDEAAVPATDATKDLPFNFFSFKDGFKSKQIYNLPEDKTFSTTSFNCRPTQIGVPLGRTFRNCSAEEKTLAPFAGKDIPKEICALVGGSAFDRCAEGNFHDCLAEIVVRGVLDTCHRDRFCREDYMCQNLPISLVPTSKDIAKRMEENEIGFCTPTYFLYQMRLDGHIVPQ